MANISKDNVPDTVIERFLSGDSAEQIARLVRMPVSQLQGYMDSVEFQKSVEKFCRTNLVKVLISLSANAPGVAERLLALTKSEDEKVALSACKTFLYLLREFSTETKTMVEVETVKLGPDSQQVKQRIRQLEERMGLYAKK